MQRTFLTIPKLDPRELPSFTSVRVGAGEFPTGRGGAACVTRTRDPIITNDVLYQLS
jgi:hypothetical protein